MLKEKYGNWALITGASSGIGEAFAKRFASLGLNIIIVARRIDRLNNLAKELIDEYKIKVIPVELDLTEENFLSKLESKLNDIDIGILINNAGIGINGPFVNTDINDNIRLIKLNCIAPTVLSNYFIGKMIAQKKGAVIFLSSVVGFNPTPFMSVYSASKAFDFFLAGTLWYELKNYNIDVLAVAPGSTNTEFHRLNNTNKFLAKPEDVVSTALDALGKKAYVVHGFSNKLLVHLGKILPKSFIIGLIGNFTRKMWGKNYGIHS